MIFQPFDEPTLHRLGVHPSFIDAVSPLEQATKWLSAFEAGILTEDIDLLVSLFHEHGFWKDVLTLTWDLRTIRGRSSIRQLLDNRLAVIGLSTFHLLEDAVRGPTIIRPYSGLVFIRFCFDFETKHGRGTSIVFLVPTSSGSWKAWSLLTRLGSLKAHPPKIGALRIDTTDNESWKERRQGEINFDQGDPTVLVIGAGHSGLDVAARLSCIGVPTLIIDRQERVGDSWRRRYDALRIHDTVWSNQMPYLDYPKTWPVHCSGSKVLFDTLARAFPDRPEVADWLESYASALDLNIWLRSSITSTNFDKETKTWQVTIDRDGKLRTMKVKHLVFATGFGGAFPKMPDIPGKELYHGSVLHSTQYTSARNHNGKVVVVGSGTSAHDIAHDLSNHGCDVTMIQRSPTYVISHKAFENSLGVTYNEHFPIEFADDLDVALPFATLKCLVKASVATTANGIDRELLGDLTKVGFQTYLGPDGAGALTLIPQRGGGLYIDTGASKEIINGNIKVKGGSVRSFTEKGLELEDGNVLEAGLVVFATGFGDIRSSIVEVCGPEVASKVGPVWGLDAEGELQGVWRRTGHPRLWIAMANFARSRIHSLHLALQIKAIEEGIVVDGEIWN